MRCTLFITVQIKKTFQVNFCHFITIKTKIACGFHFARAGFKQKQFLNENKTPKENTSVQTISPLYLNLTLVNFS
jgi:hypothetical protein